MTVQRVKITPESHFRYRILPGVPGQLPSLEWEFDDQHGEELAVMLERTAHTVRATSNAFGDPQGGLLPGISPRTNPKSRMSYQAPIVSKLDPNDPRVLQFKPIADVAPAAPANPATPETEKKE